MTAKKSRRPVRSAAAEVGGNRKAPPVLEQAGDASLTRRASGGAHIPANDDRKSAIVTVGDRKTAQRQREQQQMAKLMATEEVSPEIKDLVDRMLLGRWPGSALPKKL